MNERAATEYRCPAPHVADRARERCNAMLGRGSVPFEMWFETKCARGHLVRIEGARVTVVEDSRVPELAGAGTR